MASPQKLTPTSAKLFRAGFIVLAVIEACCIVAFSARACFNSGLMRYHWAICATAGVTLLCYSLFQLLLLSRVRETA